RPTPMPPCLPASGGCRRLPADLHKAQRAPDSSSFRAAITAHGRERRWTEAVWLLSEMAKLDLPEWQGPDAHSAYCAALDFIPSIDLAQALFQEAVDRRIFPQFAEMAQGCRTLDLHGLSVGAAAAAVCWWLQRLQKLATSNQECIIVTGWGRSRPDGQGSRIQQMVYKLLEEMRIPAEANCENRGRIRLVVNFSPVQKSS
ncbi:unnamed protein product, partial [Symbiodinium microadriaticum]